MSHIRRVALAIVLGVSVPAGVAGELAGCSQPVVPTNVIAIAQTVAQTATTVVSDAQAVWPLLIAALPADKQAAAQDAFDKAVFAANHAILALNDVIQAAVAANTPNPDFTAAISAVADAVAQVVAIVQSLQSSSPAAAAVHVQTAGGVDAIADMSAASVKLKVLAGKH